MNQQTEITLIRLVDGIGIDSKGRGYTIDGTPVKRSYLSNRLCYRVKSNIVGYRTLARSEPVKIVITKPKNICPF